MALLIDSIRNFYCWRILDTINFNHSIDFQHFSYDFGLHMVGILYKLPVCLGASSVGAGMRRPLFDGSFFGNLGTFRELLGNLLLLLPFYWELVEAPCLFGSFQKLPNRQGASTSFRPFGSQNH